MPTFNLPFGGKLVTKDGTWTQAMWAWMRDLTHAAGGGGGIVTAVTATSPIVSSGGVTPNISHATSGVTAATYGSATQVPQFAVNATGHITGVTNVTITGNSVIRGTPVTLTDAQIKALPTTGIVTLPASGASLRYTWVWWDLQANFSAGAYTNVDPDGYLVGRFVSNGAEFTNYIANDSTIPLTYLSTFMGAATKHQAMQPYTAVEPVNSWGNLVQNPSAATGNHANDSMEVIANNPAGNFTGGNAANTLVVTPFYMLAAA